MLCIKKMPLKKYIKDGKTVIEVVTNMQSENDPLNVKR